MAITARLIGCRGGDKFAPKILADAGWEYGSRSDYKIYAPPVFIDINWRHYSWLRHWLVLRRWRPEMGMAADYECPSQKSVMLRQAMQIRALGIRPMVCPKFPGATQDIPNECIVAVSVPTGYAGYLPPANEVAGRDLHLLGGHPDQHVLIGSLYGESYIKSIDCSAIFQKARFGAFWDADKGDWIYTEPRSHNSRSLIIKSAMNIKKYFQSEKFGFMGSNRRAQSVLQMSMF